MQPKQKDAAIQRLKDASSTHVSDRGHEKTRLAHDLEVHKIELETQNAELCEVRDRLESSLHEFVQFFDSAPIPYIALNRQSTVTQINRQATLLLGRSAEFITHLTMETLIVPKHQHHFRYFWNDVWSSPGDESLLPSCEIELQTGNSNRLPVNVKLTGSVLYRQGVGTLLIALEDITERKRYESELRASEQALIQADRNKDDFLATLAHELRNPLSPIRSSLEMLRCERVDESTRERALKIIHRQVDHMTCLVDELLDVSRISRAKVRLQLIRVDFTKLVHRAVDDHRATCQAKGIFLSLEAPTALWIEADSTRITQVVSNLLSNAIKFTQAGGSIAVVAMPREGSALLSVTDTGVGIAPEAIDQIFEPFVQSGQTIERVNGGLGLGLATVRGLVELQGGSATIASDGLDHGTRVEVRLPLKSAPAQTAIPAGRATENPCRLVVIDDNIDAADSLRDFLSCRGHQVEVAYDGRSGLQLVQKTLPQAVICDIGLPVMDGYAVAQAIREDARQSGVCLIALTGYARSEDAIRAKNAGFDIHMEKPCNPTALVDKLFHIGRPMRRQAVDGV